MNKLPVVFIFTILVLASLTVRALPPPLADTDGDGMPDSWEDQYGLDKNNPNDATADLDRDGLSNLREYQNLTDPTSALSGGKAMVAYTYDHEMTTDKISLLLDSGFNTFVVKGGLDNNHDYSTDADQLPQSIHDYAALAYTDHFMYFQGLYFVFRNFPDNNHVPGAYPVTYSDGVTGTHVSPFSAAYWHHLTNLTIALANLSMNHPTEYRCDGVWIDFELYHQEDEGRPRNFDGTWGFEDTTFTLYIQDRGLQSQNPPTNPGQAAQRYTWLASHSLLSDYYTYLAGLLHTYANEMRTSVHQVNPSFLIGACPSPVTGYWYLPELDTGWSTPTEPLVLWATETYNGHGTTALPPTLPSLKQPDTTYNLSSLYPSQNTTTIRIYAYYLAGLRLPVYYTGSLAYHLYSLMQKTNGYWVFSTQSLTQPYHNLTSDYHLPYHNTTTNTLTTATNDNDHAQTTLHYLANFSRAATETQHALNDTSYTSPLGYWTPPPVQYEDPDPLTFTQPNLAPLSNQTIGTYSFASNQLRFRGQHAFLLYTHAGQTVNITLRHIAIGSPEIIDGLSYTVTSPSQTIITSGKLTTNQTATISFLPAATGFYLLHINPISNAFELLTTTVPIAVYQTTPLHLMSLPGSLFLWIPTNDTGFTINLTGFGTTEGANLTVQHPTRTDYELIAAGETTTGHNAIDLAVNIPANDTQSLWKIAVKAPHAPQHLEDFLLEFSSNHTILSLSNDSRLALAPVAGGQNGTQNQSQNGSQNQSQPPGGNPPGGGDPSPPSGGDGNETNSTLPPQDDNSTTNETIPPGGGGQPPVPPAGNESQNGSSATGKNGSQGSPLGFLGDVVTQPLFLVVVAVVGCLGAGIVIWLRQRPSLEALEDEQEILAMLSRVCADPGSPESRVLYERARGLLLESEPAFGRWQYHSLQKELLTAYDALSSEGQVEVKD